MASGGFRPNKSSKSQGRRRGSWKHSASSDRDDAQSLNSFLSDMRINNWDLSDLRPSNLGGDSKRCKKSKGNPEREKEQSLSLESPPHDKKQYRSSFPRSSGLKSQRVALENLKHHMALSDVEDQVSADGERNNERQVSQGRWRLHNASLNRAISEDDFRGAPDRHVNRNNNMDYSSTEQGPDSNEIMAHLMQIRDFTKQARSMLESMEKLGDRKKAEDIEKVRRLIRNLQEQEQGYRGLLQNTLTHNDDDDGDGDEAVACGDGATMKVEMKYDSDDDDTSVDLEVQTEESDTTENSQDLRPRIESKLGIGSSDGENADENPFRLPARGSTSEKTNSHKQADLENSLIQEHLSLLRASTGEGEAGGKGDSDNEGASMRHRELLRILREKEQQLQALMNRQEELNVRRRETEKKLLEAQTRDNKARAALVAVTVGRQILEHRIANHQAQAEGSELGVTAWEMNGNDDESGAVGEDRQLKSNIVGYPESDDEDNSKVCEVESLPSELMELKRQLNYLRNEFSQVGEAPKNVESDEGRQQLQNKLQKLQNKKSRMDLLWQELRMLQAQPLEHVRNNETNPQPVTDQAPSTTASNIPTSGPQKSAPSRPAPPNVSANAGHPNKHPPRSSDSKAVGSADVDSSQRARDASFEQEVDTVEAGMVQDMQEKLRRLKEVRGQLDQLRSLVQYYQGQKVEAEAVDVRDSPPTLPGFADNTVLRPAAPEVRTSQSSIHPQSLKQQQGPDVARLQTQQRRRQAKDSETATATSSSLHNIVQLPNLAGTDQGGELSDEDNVSVSQTESQWSHLGPWDDDPEIQEKVRKLRAAKEKLRQLQDLVAFVQQSPDTATAASENIGDLTTSLEGKAVSHATQTDNLSVSVSEGEIPSESVRIASRDGLIGSEDSRAAVSRLRKERSMLLEIQNQLKSLHQQTPTAQGREEVQEEENVVKTGLEQVPSGTVVTFASNDELYSKMRRQRMLREELRSKKKELEAIMKKDRNKRQYSRNQDNQSDTVSLNTDTFGVPASVDATMATWGGSTVDNLENITEDESRQERNDCRDGNEDEEDDGYPSDGIVQVEEEEEENESDNGTYTVERDVRQRQTVRNDGNNVQGARPKTSRGRQTYSQPTYRDTTNRQKLSRKQGDRSFQNARDARSRREVLSLESREEGELLQQPDVQWLRSIDNKLSNLGASVEMLLRQPDTEGKQLSTSLNQDTCVAGAGGNLLSPVQEQMLQLQNQAMMLSFGHLVQSMTHQQGDIQQLQQQVQALQLQLQEVLHECSFHTASTTGASHPQLMHPPLLNPGLNNSGYNLHTATLGAHSLALNRQQLSPLAQTNLSSSLPFGVFSELSAHSPGVGSYQPSSLGLAVSNLSLGLDRRAAGGSTSLGASLSVNTGSHLSLPHQDAGVAVSSLGQSVLNTRQSQHPRPAQAVSSTGGLAKDLRQLVTSLHSTPQATDSRFSVPEPDSQLYQQRLVSRFPLPPATVGDAAETDVVNPRPRVLPGVSDDRSHNRRFDLKVTKSESDPTSGVKLSTEVDNFQFTGRSHRDMVTAEPSKVNDVGLHGSSSVSDGGTAAAAGTTRDSSLSYAQFIRDKHSRLRRQQTHAQSNAGAESNSLFDTLRDNIYAEVASVISQNEGNPHFLLELFRDMRQIDSDHMRQQTLYSLQELLRSNVRSRTTVSESLPFWSHSISNTGGKRSLEQTPSESINSEDDDDDDDMKVAQFQDEVSAAGRNWLDRVSQDNPVSGYPFGYLETANNPCSESTSTNGGEESPFLQDALGETVIEFSSLKQGAQEALGSQDVSRTSNQQRFMDHQLAQNVEHGVFKVPGKFVKYPNNSRLRQKRDLRAAVGAESGLRSQCGDMAGHAAMDQGSESSLSDMPYAGIDMKQLDQHIKDIIMKTIPLVKEHMEETCTGKLLANIKCLILFLTSQISSQQFFQVQLGSVLEDTLLKYQGRRMRDCGEGLLVEISDVLFNELAFFRLTQGLDDPNSSRKLKSTTDWQTRISRDNSPEYTASCSTSEGFDEDNNNSEDNKHEDGGTDTTLEVCGATGQLRTHTQQQQQVVDKGSEARGKHSDVREMDEKDDDESEQLYKIELAPSETKPFTRIGSDEDDDEEDEECSMDDPSDTAVSRDSLLEITGQSAAAMIPLSTRPETEGAQGDEEEKQDLEKPVSPKKVGQATGTKSPGEGAGTEVVAIHISTSQMVADTVQVNGAASEESHNDSDVELTVEDLPEALTVPSATLISVNNNNNNNNTVEE